MEKVGAAVCKHLEEKGIRGIEQARLFSGKPRMFLGFTLGKPALKELEIRIPLTRENLESGEVKKHVALAPAEKLAEAVAEVAAIEEEIAKWRNKRIKIIFGDWMEGNNRRGFKITIRKA